MKKFLHVISKLYGWLLRLYPRDFREEFFDEMLLDFAETVETESKRGTASLFVVLLREVRDFPINLLHTHLNKEHMLNIFQIELLSRNLRIAVAFGVALAITNLTGILAFTAIAGPNGLKFFHFASSIGLRLNYKITEQTMMYFFNIIVGPLLAGLFLMLVLPETRQFKRLLAVSVLGLGLPSILDRVVWNPSINTDSFLVNVVLYLGHIILTGLGLGAMFSLITHDRKKILWLLFVGVLGYFFANSVQGSLIWRFELLNRYTPFWKETLFIATIQIVEGTIVGALLGVASMWSKQKATPA